MTKEEFKEEARRRGYKKGTIINHLNPFGVYTTYIQKQTLRKEDNGFFFREEKNEGYHSGWLIYRGQDNKWAEIINL